MKEIKKHNMLRIKLGYFFSFICFSTVMAQTDHVENPDDYFLNKGKVYAGITFSFDNSNVENEDRLIVFIEDRKNNSFDLKVHTGYFIRKNWAVGGLINYTSSDRTGVDISTQNISSQVNIASKSWGIYGTTKFYIPLESRNRFFLFTEVLAGGSFANQLKESTAYGILTRTFVEDRSAEIRFVPGIMVKVIRGFSVEAGAQIAGINAKWSNTSVNNVLYSKKESVSTNLSINLLRLSLGFYYYFDLKTKPL
ncbi:hypothetical protein AR687_22875 [Flavobacteriaceae bacterium CRH]|nr:hypothetical protein AR687_22875 [Flavobacteriaceae bacterium CRH]